MLCPTKFMCWYSLFLLWFNHTSKSCQFKQDIWIGLTLLGELVSSSNFEKLCQLLLLSRVVQIQCNDWSTLLYIFCILPNTKMCKSMPPSLMTMILVSSSIKLGEGNGTPLQDSCLENPMDGGAWWAAVYGVAKSQTWLSDFTFTFHFHALEEEMATHSSVLAWRIPGTGEPGGLPSMGSHGVGHNWSDLAAAV